VLTGKPHERISRNQHDRISTWGIGTELSANQWRGLFRQLLVYDYLQSDADQYGGMRLTVRAKPLLSGDESLRLREVSRTRQKPASRTAAPSLEASDQPLFDALRALRKSSRTSAAYRPTSFSTIKPCSKWSHRYRLICQKWPILTASENKNWNASAIRFCP